MREGVARLVRDRTRKPGLQLLPPAVVNRVVTLTLSDPLGETTQWSGRAMAKHTGVSLRSVQRIWAAHGLQPHRVRRYKLSTDPAFAAKLRDVAGLYLEPPAHSRSHMAEAVEEVGLGARSGSGSGGAAECFAA
jgi:hypothetical protein